MTTKKGRFYGNCLPRTGPLIKEANRLQALSSVHKPNNEEKISLPSIAALIHFRCANVYRICNDVYICISLCIIYIYIHISMYILYTWKYIYIHWYQLAHIQLPKVYKNQENPGISITKPSGNSVVVKRKPIPWPVLR